MVPENFLRQVPAEKNEGIIEKLFVTIDLTI